MIYHRLGLINKGQKGFTLTDLILAIAITVIITAVITLTVFQVIAGSARTKNHMTAVRQVQSAGYWVSHDAQMAKDVTTDDDPGTPELVTLAWTEWEDPKDSHQVVYSLLADNQLQRSDSVNGEAPTVAPVAEFINPDPAKTICAWDGFVLTFKVTATVGTGSPHKQSETRIYEVMPRPGL